jgi:hypothetical protein
MLLSSEPLLQVKVMPALAISEPASTTILLSMLQLSEMFDVTFNLPQEVEVKSLLLPHVAIALILLYVPAGMSSFHAKGNPSPWSHVLSVGAAPLLQVKVGSDTFVPSATSVPAIPAQ